jgi:hypothetical protein
LQALFDDGDVLAHKAIERIDKLVDLGLQHGNIGVRGCFYAAKSKNSR